MKHLTLLICQGVVSEWLPFDVIIAHETCSVSTHLLEVLTSCNYDIISLDCSFVCVNSLYFPSSTVVYVRLYISHCCIRKYL